VKYSHLSNKQSNAAFFFFFPQRSEQCLSKLSPKLKILRNLEKQQNLLRHVGHMCIFVGGLLVMVAQKEERSI